MNKDLIKLVGGIDEARKIVGGMPNFDMPMHYNIPNGVWVLAGFRVRLFVNGKWVLLENSGLGEFEFNTVSAHQLRTAIAENLHDTCADIKEQHEEELMNAGFDGEFVL